MKYSGAQKFETKIEESYITDGENLYNSCNFSVSVSCSIKAEVRRADGSIITEEENRKMITESNKAKMNQIILDSCANMNIQEQDRQRLIRLFKVEDPVIRYFILYSWLSELLLRNGRENQDEVNKFIENSDIYATMPNNLKNPPTRNGRDDKTYFTYLRNLMGHTVTDALAASDVEIINMVKTCTSWLFRILLEKIIPA